MIHDAKVEVTCDGDCGECLEVEPEYKYTNYSGGGGHYDCSDDALNEKVEREGWTVDEDKHYCENCKEEV